MNRADVPAPPNLRRDAGLVGAIALTILVLLQFLFPLVLLVVSVTGLAQVDTTQPLYGLRPAQFLGVYGVTYVLGMGLPAPMLAALARRRIRPFASDPPRPPLDGLSVPLILAAGMAICVLANFATSYITYIFSLFGIRPMEMDSYLQPTLSSLLLNLVVFSLLPAVLEEMVYRGYFIKLLRPYGDTLAVVVSAVLFGLMHGNLLQFPFALMLGLAFGYIAVRTRRIWITMILHFLNNALANVLQYLGLYCTEQQASRLVLVTFCLLGIAGLAAIIGLYARQDLLVRHRPKTAEKPRWGELLRSAPLVLAALASLLIVIGTTQWGGGAA